MQEYKSNPNQDDKALQFLAAHARRTGRPLDELLKLVEFSGDTYGLYGEVQQSKEEHLDPNTGASPGLSVGLPNLGGNSSPLGMTVASVWRGPQDAMVPYRREERRRRWLARILAAFGLGLEGQSQSTAARLARLLLELALDVALRRYGGYARHVAVVTLMLPTDLLAAHLEVRRETIWRALKKLKEVGIVDARVWRTTSGGETRAGGTLFAVRLKPGTRARLAYDDFKYPWRNLDGDRARGRTAWAWIQSGQRPGYDVLLAWALGERVAPGEEPAPIPALYDIHALPGMLPHEAAGMVTALAEYLARRMNDDHSRAFYAKLLWKVVYLEFRPEVLITQIERVLKEAEEGWVRNPGALLSSRLTA